MLGWLITAEASGERLSRDEIHDILGLLIIAGLDTVAGSLACFLSYFARHPEQRAKNGPDPSGWPTAVEELMRFESPVTDGGRIALDDLDLPSGEKIERLAPSWACRGQLPISTPSTSLTHSASISSGLRSPYRLRQWLSPLPRISLGPHGDGRGHGRLASAHPDYQIKPGTDSPTAATPEPPTTSHSPGTSNDHCYIIPPRYSHAPSSRYEWIAGRLQGGRFAGGFDRAAMTYDTVIPFFETSLAVAAGTPGSVRSSARYVPPLPCRRLAWSRRAAV